MECGVAAPLLRSQQKYTRSISQSPHRRNPLPWTSIMKTKLPNAAHVWKQVDDFVMPTLRLNAIDRAVYSHLLRHTRLEGRHHLCLTRDSLGEGIGVCGN